MAQVVLEVPDDVLERAENEARRRHRSIESLLAETLSTSIRTPDVTPESDVERWQDVDLSGLSDEALQAHIRTPLPREFVRRMDELSEQNGAGTLAEEGRRELERMLRVVHSSTMLKALALRAWKERHGSLPDQIQADW